MEFGAVVAEHRGSVDVDIGREVRIAGVNPVAHPLHRCGEPELVVAGAQGDGGSVVAAVDRDLRVLIEAAGVAGVVKIAKAVAGAGEAGSEIVPDGLAHGAVVARYRSPGGEDLGVQVDVGVGGRCPRRILRRPLRRENQIARNRLRGEQKACEHRAQFHKELHRTSIAPEVTEGKRPNRAANGRSIHLRPKTCGYRFVAFPAKRRAASAMGGPTQTMWMAIPMRVTSSEKPWRAYRESGSTTSCMNQ